MFDACSLNNVTNAHIRRASHLATLTIKTPLERLIEKLGTLQSQTLTIGARLLGTRI
jgi:hypothetical protein